jgi:hypothetical protein
MPQNLVEGGARRGLFQTRHSRLVRLIERFEFSEPPQPGADPKTRICWKGELYLGDGHTVDSNGVWEQSGAFQVQNGVIQRNDLVILVRLDPEPVEQIAEPEEEASELRPHKPKKFWKKPAPTEPDKAEPEPAA